MSSQLIIILGLTLATLLCAVVTVLLYRRSAKQWYWFVSALIGGAIAFVPLYQGLLGFSGISQQPALILSLVLAALIYGVAILLYRRSGASTKEWYVFIGAVIAVLLFFALLGFFVGAASTSGAPWVAYVGSLITLEWSLWRRARTR